jgi:hypothetical protein
VVELAAWSGCAFLGLLAASHTLGADFPARDRALVGEAVCVASALLLAALGAARLARSVRARPPKSPTWAALLPAVRVALGVPFYLFWLVASAAGFAA